jgi:hypothetical protein
MTDRRRDFYDKKRVTGLTGSSKIAQNRTT